VKPERYCGKDRGGVGAGTAFERLADMLDAASRGDPVARKQCELGGTVHQPFHSIESVGGCDLPDRVHSLVNVQGRQALGAVAELSESLADLVTHWSEPVRHPSSPVEAIMAATG
jgi:hypothetical protein